jgi:hypothetical protein
MGRVRKRQALAAAAAAAPPQRLPALASQVELAPELQGDECVGGLPHSLASVVLQF